jgi:hypothetical protein
MSQGNVDLVRTIHAAWEQRYCSDAQWADSEIEFVSVGGTRPGTWHKPGPMLTWWGWFRVPWEYVDMELEECREVDDEHVLALVQVSGRHKREGLLPSRRAAALFSIRRRRVTRFVFYWDRTRAFADLGVSEQDFHADP